MIDTSLESDQAIASLRHIAGGVFEYCRYRLQNAQDNDSECHRLIEAFTAHNIGYLRTIRPVKMGYPIARS